MEELMKDQTYVFGEFVFDRELRQLFKNGQPRRVGLREKETLLLTVLLEHAMTTDRGKGIDAHELQRRIEVSEVNTVRAHVSSLRTKLTIGNDKYRYVPERSYRLAVTVSLAGKEALREWIRDRDTGTIQQGVSETGQARGETREQHGKSSAVRTIEVSSGRLQSVQHVEPAEVSSDSLRRSTESITPVLDSEAQRNLRSINGFLGGEGRICLAVSLGYGVMMGVSLPMEVAYRWSEFENWVASTSVIIGACSAAVAIMAFELIRRRAAAGRFDSLGRAAGILSVWSIAISVLVAAWLPDEPITKASVPTMTAKVGWPKSVLEALGLPILSLVPIQAVFALRNLISSGHQEIARVALQRNAGLAGVPGAFVPGAWPSFAAFAVVVLWRISVDGHLIESLKQSPYYGLFLECLVTRSGVGCLMLFTVLLWYLLRLNGFEHEVRRRD